MASAILTGQSGGKSIIEKLVKEYTLNENINAGDFVEFVSGKAQNARNIVKSNNNASLWGTNASARYIKGILIDANKALVCWADSPNNYGVVVTFTNANVSVGTVTTLLNSGTAKPFDIIKDVSGKIIFMYPLGDYQYGYKILTISGSIIPTQEKSINTLYNNYGSVKIIKLSSSEYVLVLGSQVQMVNFDGATITPKLTPIENIFSTQILDLISINNNILIAVSNKQVRAIKYDSVNDLWIMSNFISYGTAFNDTRNTKLSINKAIILYSDNTTRYLTFNIITYDAETHTITLGINSIIHSGVSSPLSLNDLSENKILYSYYYGSSPYVIAAGILNTAPFYLESGMAISVEHSQQTSIVNIENSRYALFATYYSSSLAGYTNKAHNVSYGLTPQGMAKKTGLKNDTIKIYDWS